MTFFYDPDVYRPLNRFLRLSDIRPYSVLFVGSVSESAASNRKTLIERISKYFRVHVMTFKNPRLEGVTWHRASNRPWIVNWHFNRAHLVLNIEDVGETYAPENQNRLHDTRIVPYRDQKVFHGNHIFPAMGAGRVCLSESSFELERFCRDKANLLTWRDADESVEKVRWSIAHPEEMAAIRMNALKTARENHTAAIRLRELFSLSGIGAELSL